MNTPETVQVNKVLIQDAFNIIAQSSNIPYSAAVVSNVLLSLQNILGVNTQVKDNDNNTITNSPNSKIDELATDDQGNLKVTKEKK